MHIDMELIVAESEFKAVRSRGPGGQNVNKVSSAAVLRWNWRQSTLLTPFRFQLLEAYLSKLEGQDPYLWVRSDEFRDLPRNKARCVEKMEEILLAAFHIPKARRATKPTRSSQRRRVDGKKHRGQIKSGRKRFSSDD
jgi:ribosome-associated protein